MKFEIHNRWSRRVQVTTEIDCPDDASPSLKIGLAVKCAFSRSANLSGADLYDANLSGTNLSGANLNGANLRSANLSGTNLSGANLNGANLRSANLSGANLNGANLSGADLYDANLSGTNLSGANLNGANLGEGAKYGNIPILIPPLSLTGMEWPILILDGHMRIGGQFHRIDEWEQLTDNQIAAMAGDALEWWRIWRMPLLGLAHTHAQQAAKQRKEIEANKAEAV